MQLFVQGGELPASRNVFLEVCNIIIHCHCCKLPSRICQKMTFQCALASQHRLLRNNWKCILNMGIDWISNWSLLDGFGTQMQVPIMNLYWYQILCELK